jgi:hypothetical protein
MWLMDVDVNESIFDIIIIVIIIIIIALRPYVRMQLAQYKYWSPLRTASFLKRCNPLKFSA